MNLERKQISSQNWKKLISLKLKNLSIDSKDFSVMVWEFSKLVRVVSFVIFLLKRLESARIKKLRKRNRHHAKTFKWFEYPLCYLKGKFKDEIFLKIWICDVKMWIYEKCFRFCDKDTFWLFSFIWNSIDMPTDCMTMICFVCHDLYAPFILFASFWLVTAMENELNMMWSRINIRQAVFQSISEN